MKPEPLELQHDDHCWLTIKGEGWAIREMDWPFLWLWRGYHPNIHHMFMDMTDFRPDEYVNEALRMLAEAYPRG